MMRPPLLLTALAMISLGTPALYAINGSVDNFSTGPGQGVPDTLDDVWQATYNAWGMDPNADDDKDGCSNFVESLAGSDPRNPGDCLKVGNMAISASNIVMSFTGKKGKKYQVWESSSLTGPLPGQVGTSWTEVSGATKTVTVDGPDNITFAKPSGTRKFYRLESRDVDSDGDGVSDWAEGKLGTDPATSNSGNVSGNAYTYADTVRSMMSLTISTASVDTAGFEVVDRSITPTTTKAAKIALVRSWPPVGDPVPAMPINGITFTGANGAPDATKANATSGTDYTTLTVNIPAGAGVTGSPYEVDAVAPVKDAFDEVPEYAAITARLPLPGSPAAAGTATVCICDSDPANADNNTLYVAYLGHEAGAATTASGYATAVVNGDNTSASISLVFNNLSSTQNTAYIRAVSGGVPANDLAPQLPNGQVSGFTYNVVYKPGFYSTDQGFLTALGSGGIGCAVSSANFTDKEIFGIFNKATGSTTFDPNNPSLVSPATGDSNFQTTTSAQIERDIWRFMSQCTWGGTTVMYNAIRAKVDARVNALSGSPTAQQITDAYLQGLSDWLDEQMNASLTPSINFRTLVMATDNEDFMLRGNREQTYANDPQTNGVAYAVTYDAAGNPTISTTADGNRISTNYPISGPNRRRAWWGMVLQCKDQVRQRFTQALSEIIVISEADQTCADHHYGLANYWDMMASNAFGKYRNLLQNVTYSPMMGVYLSHMANRQTYDAGGGLIVSPDENYAREIMQLFSVGLVLRHPDGSLVLDSAGLPIATYDQTDITELARVMTGFSHGARHAIGYSTTWNSNTLNLNPQNAQRVSDLVLVNGSSSTNTWFGRDDGHLFWAAPWTYPMKVIGRIGTTIYHDFGVKTLFAGKSGETTVPAQTVTTSSPASDAATHTMADADLTIAHNCLAGDPTSNTSYNGHQNTPVNMSRWLIQRLTTSNPSAGYIYRVQKRYRDTNGNLGEVLKSILLDYEARSLQLADSSISAGKVKEPLVAFASLLRGFRAFSGAPMSILSDNAPPFSASDSPLPGPYPSTEMAKYSSDNLNPPSLPTGWAQGPFRFLFNDLTSSLGQSPQRAPSVFNWFLPDYVEPGPMAQAGLFAPELQINTEANVVAKANAHASFAVSNLTGMSTQPGSDLNISDFNLSNAFATPAVRFSLDGGQTFVSSLTFTSANWNTPQTLTVVGANTTIKLASLDDSTLRFTVAGAGSGFDQIATTPLAINFSDNETPNEGLIALHTSFSTWVQEGGNTDTVTCRLSSPPPSGSTVTVNVAPAGTQVTVSPTTLTFDSTNWGVDQVVTVTAINDATSETSGSANDAVNFTSTSTIGAWNNLTASLPVNVVDNDDGANSYGIVVTETNGSTQVTESTATSVTAGIVDNFNIVLTKLPTATVTVTITQNTTTGTQLNMNTTTGGTTFQTGAVTRTFTTANWNVAQEVRVRGAQDSTVEGSYPANPLHYGVLTITAANGGYTGVQAQPVTATVTDDDTRVIIAHGGTDASETRVMEGGAVTDTITVKLATLPTTNVTVNLGSSSCICTPANLVFTPANYNVAQTVTVSAEDDSVPQGLRRTGYYNVLPLSATATATLTSGAVSAVTLTNAGAGYMTPPTVTFTAAPTGGTTATGFATLNATGGIASITLTNPGAGYVSTPTVSITAAPNITANTIIASATSDGITDANYNNYWNQVYTALHVTIIDNDNAGLAINASGGNTTVVEGNGSDDVTIALTQQPTANVTVTLSPSTQVNCTPTTLTFTPANWATAQTVTVTGVNDTTVEGDALTNIGVLVTSTDVVYKGVKTKPIPVTVIDNDLVPLSITHTNVFTGVAEGGTAGTGGTPNVSDTFTVSLPKTPSATVTVDLLFDSSQIAVSPSTLTFLTTNSTTAQTVTVTAVDDAVAETTPHITPIRFKVSSTDAFYNNPAHLPIYIPIKDNDAPGFSIVESSGNTTPTEGGTDSYTIVLTKAPTTNVLVDVTSNNSADVLVSATTALPGCATTNTSTSVTVPNSAGLVIGSTVSGTGIPTGATITAIPTGTTITISAAATATGSNVTLTFAVPPVASLSLIFTPANWSTAQTVTTTAVADMITEGREMIPISHSIRVAASDATYASVGSQTVNCFVTDQHRRNESLVIIPSGGSIRSGDATPTGGNTFVTEGDGSTDSIQFYLSNPPQFPVTVTLSANAQMAYNQSIFYFDQSNWNVPQTVVVSAIDDTVNDTATGVAQSQNITFQVTGDPQFANVNPTSAVNIIDNDSPGVSIVQSGGITQTSETGPTSDTYTAVLTKQPNANVVVRVTSASTSAGQTVSPAVLTFTSANWNTPQTVTVTAVNDATVEGNHQSNVTHAIRTAVVLPLPSSSTSGSSTTVTTASTVGLFTGMVVVGTGVPLNATIASIPTSTTFTLSSAATIASGTTLTAYGTTPDSTGAVLLLTNGVTNSGSTTITCASTASLSPGTLLYGTGIPAGATVASVTNSTTFESSIAATAAGTGLTLAAIAATADTSGYVLPITGVSTTAASTTVTCTSTTGLAASMQVTGQGIPAGATISSVTNGTTFVLSSAASATNTGLTLNANMVGIQTVVNNIDDNDNRIIVLPTGNDTRVAEDGTAGDTYTVVLRSAPTANVTVTPSIAGTTFAAQGLSISPTTLTFTTANWATPQTITLTGVDNGNDAERARTLTIAHASTSSDANFNAQTIHSVAVSMLAKDTTPRLLLVGNPSVTENGSPSTYTVALSRAPTTDVTVTIDGGTQLEWAPPLVAPATVLSYANTGTLTFTTSNWMNFQTVTVRAIDDTVTENQINVGSSFIHLGQLLHTMSSTGVSGYELPSVSLTNVATTLGSATATCDSTTGLRVGMTLSGGSIPAGTCVSSVTNATTFALSTLATATESGVAVTASVAAANCATTITDNETPSVRIVPSGGSTVVTEGGATDTYDVSLSTAPTADVTISISTDAQVTTDKATLTFTSADWNVPQTVTVTAVNDVAVEGTHSGVITHGIAVSTDPVFSGMPVPAVTATVRDNDGAQLVVTETGGNTTVVEGGANDTIQIALSQAPTANVTVTLVPPTYIIPVPPYAKQFGYFTSDLSGSNQNRERVVLDYSEWIDLYRSTFYGSLATAYGGSGNIPAQPSETNIKNAHWEATKAIVDKGDTWFCGGFLKAKNPVLIEPNQAAPVPLPGPNARQAIMDCIFQMNGGANSLGTTRYIPQSSYDHKNPPTTTFDTEVRDRCRYTGYLTSTVMSGFVAH